MRAVEVSRYGGTEVLTVVDRRPPIPATGQILVRVSIAGVNYMDIYARMGVAGYGFKPPFLLGAEGVGEVIELGADVNDFHIGDHVAWKLAWGSYADVVAVDALQAITIPKDVPEEIAAAVMLQGLTAHYLVSSTYPVGPQDTILIHAAAGGVGALLTQMAKLRGARVIATVSSSDKEGLARSAGADEVIRYDQVEVAPRVLHLTNGQGVSVVYDGVGQSTFGGSLASLRTRGYLVIFGAASGPVPPIDVMELNRAGSVYVTRPTLGHYTRSRDELLARTDELFGWIAEKKISPHIGGRYPLKDAARAHQDLEARRTSGKLLLLT
jgi:NADPH:quinone reductase